MPREVLATATRIGLGRFLLLDSPRASSSASAFRVGSSSVGLGHFARPRGIARWERHREAWRGLVFLFPSPRHLFSLFSPIFYMAVALADGCLELEEGGSNNDEGPCSLSLPPRLLVSAACHSFISRPPVLLASLIFRAAGALLSLSLFLSLLLSPGASPSRQPAPPLYSVKKQGPLLSAPRLWRIAPLSVPMSSSASASRPGRPQFLPQLRHVPDSSMASSGSAPAPAFLCLPDF